MVQAFRARVLFGIFSASCAPVTNAQPAEIDAGDMRAASRDSHADMGLRFTLSDGQTLIVRNAVAVIEDRYGTLVAENRNLMKVADEHGTCPSRGLIDIIVDTRGFTIHQQNCTGWHFIDETMVFEFSPEGSYQLQEAVFRYSDRRDPEREDIVKILRLGNIDAIEFGEVDSDGLYALMNQQRAI